MAAFLTCAASAAWAASHRERRVEEGVGEAAAAGCGGGVHGGGEAAAEHCQRHCQRWEAAQLRWVFFDNVSIPGYRKLPAGYSSTNSTY